MKSIFPREARVRDLPAVLESCFGSLLDDWLKDDSFFGTMSKHSYPKVNISEDGKFLYLEATVPGLTKEDVSITLKDELLTIAGKKATENNRHTSHHIYCKEIHKSSFSRTFNISKQSYDLAKIDAKVENGLLTVVVPRINKEPDSRTIQIN